MPIPTSTKTPSTRINASRSSRWGAVILAILVGLLVLQFIAHLVAEAFWFQELDYLNVFRIRIVNRFGLFFLSSALSAFVLFSNLRLTGVANLASYGNPAAPPQADRSPPLEGDTSLTLLDLPSIGRLRLRILLPLAIVLSGVLIVVFLYHSQIALSHWHPHISDYQPSPLVPFSINLSSIGALLMTLRQWPIFAGIGAAVSVAILFYPRWILRAIALVMSLEFGVIMAEQWPRVLLALYPSSFNELDPLFQRDLSFYIFQLPVWTLLSFWLMGLSVIAILSAVLLYLLSGNSLSRGQFAGFTVPQMRHLFGVGSGLMGAIALMYWVRRYELLYSPRGVAFGASYTDVVVQLPVYTGLSILAMVVSALLLAYALIIRVRLGDLSQSSVTGARIVHSPSGISSPISPVVVKRSTLPPSSTARISPAGSGTQLSQPLSARQAEQRLPSSRNGQFNGQRNGQSNGQRNGQSSGQRSGQESLSPYRLNRTPVWVAASVVAYWAIATLTGTVLPGVVQRAVVQPNELQLETPFIERSIALTREAFSLDRITSETFIPQSALTAEDVEDNPQTISNIRLWDSRPLLETNRQLQRIRLYYEFNDADVDRYTITRSTGESELRQVLISARELNYADLSEDAKTWVNEHLIYTHGYGFTMSPVNTAGDDGLPEYFISGIDHIASSDAVRRSIPVNRPRIYYGELTDTYVMTQTQVRELDYPSGDENEYNTYDGNGGIPIAQFWRRIMYANHLGDWRMLLNRSFTPDTRLLYRRNIKDRVRAIAPFLEFDSDPYLVVADITSDMPSSETLTPEALGEDNLTGDIPLMGAGQRLQRGLTQTPPNTLYWIIDAYTTSRYFPYADPIDHGFNYIRNSVKVVIDAYNGTTAFFVADETDPIIQSWDGIFPDMFFPLSSMPTPLREHIRYPQDYYQVQSQHLLVYHMTDPQVFYNREDEWRTPTEIYANEQQVVEPYYLTMRLPTGTAEEFILFRPFTPIQRRNLIAWLAARSDGDRYGTQLLYTFPKQELVFGPEQIEARINQDPVISQQISLWNREGSRAVQGNLLVIPIEESLLYVEPLYLEAEQNSLPTLARVIVVFANQIAMAPTLEESLNAVFQVSGKDEAPTIVRPVDEIDIDSLDSEGLITPEASPDSNNEQPQTNEPAGEEGN
ncbi:MAG: UPF0182 family protein [Leptolyngbyaceae bacterium]|nr:UPF0182 family protein [Leptolyngbyaceae bacterium]